MGTQGPSAQTAPFAKEFEQQFNKELLIASVEEGSEPSTSQSPEVIPTTAEASFLSRGLQIPSRSKSPASGWQYVPVLERLGIMEADWKAFTSEIASHASLTKSQWMATIGRATGTVFMGGLAIGFFAIIPGVIVGKNLREYQEKKNLQAASNSGALLSCIERWNKDYFFSRGLAVRVDVPGSAKDLSTMDVLSAKGDKEDSDRGSMSTLDSGLTKGGDEETRRRNKIANRGRIVLIPLDSNSKTTEDEQIEIYTEEG